MDDILSSLKNVFSRNSLDLEVSFNFNLIAIDGGRIIKISGLVNKVFI